MKKPKLVIFDINDTLVHENTWMNLNLALGMTSEEDELLWRLNKEGTVRNDMWVEIVNGIWHKRGKASKENIEAAVHNYTYIGGAKDVIAKLQSMGIECALLSGSVDLMVSKVAKDLGISLWRSGAHIYFNPDDTFSKMTYENEEVIQKTHDLKSLCEEAGVSFDEVACVGDGANEEELFKLARGITFKGSKVESIAWKVVDKLEQIPEILA